MISVPPCQTEYWLATMNAIAGLSRHAGLWGASEHDTGTGVMNSSVVVVLSYVSTLFISILVRLDVVAWLRSH